MRLLVVTNDFPPRPGGIQQYLAGLLGAYPHPVLVYAPADGDAGLPGHIEVVRDRRSFMWPTSGVADRVEDQARRFGAEAVFFGAPYPLPWLGSRLRDRLGLPYGVLAHGAEITIPAAFPISRQLLARPLRRADLLFSNGGWTARRVGRLTRRPVTVLGGGVDLSAFSPGPAPDRRPPVVGCVSRFVPRKGQHRLIEAAAQLQERGVAVEVLLVGRGRMERRLRRLAERRGVSARFEVGVPWARLGDLYRDMDVFCMPCRSRWLGLEQEGLGLVFLEAAASGLPVLAGDSGGAPETVDPGVTGFVVRNVDDIVSGLEMLLGDPGRARAMGTAGRRRVEEAFTWDLAAARLVEAYTGLV